VLVRFGSEGCLLVPRSSSTSVATRAWPTWVVSRRRVLEAVFVLLESLSPLRRIFIDSHSLPPLWFAVSVLHSRLLTLEFLCTLKSSNDGVTFWLFRQEQTLSWRKMSNALGFTEGCALDLDSSLEDFDRLHLRSDVTGKENAHKPRTNDIQHPTLRFFHKWISLVLFPRNDNINVRVGDMQLIYAALKRQVVSPVKMLVEHWLSFPT
jgi:hypothetical protein